MIDAGEAAYPAELRAAMQRNRDEDATAALDTKALSGEFGVEVIGAAVYGLPDQKQTLVYLYESESGRTQRWFAPYEPSNGTAMEPPPDTESAGGGPPWPGYDQQSIAEIVADPRFSDTAPDRIRAYEQAHKGRKVSQAYKAQQV